MGWGLIAPAVWKTSSISVSFALIFEKISLQDWHQVACPNQVSTSQAGLALVAWLGLARADVPVLNRGPEGDSNINRNNTKKLQRLRTQNLISNLELSWST